MDKSALYKLSYGMYIVSSAKDGKFNGQIANTAFQITSEPQTVAVSINKSNLTNEYIENSGKFSLSVLNTNADLRFIGRFGFKSGRDIDKFAEVEYKLLGSGVPAITENTSAWLEFEVINKVDCGTHNVFIGLLKDAAVLNDSEPMTYDYYHKVIKGRSPKTAPTYIA